MHHALVIAGTVASVFGVLFVGAPDWWPGTRAKLLAARVHVRRLLRRPATVHVGTVHEHVHIHGAAVGVVSIADDAPADERLAFVMRQVKLLQGRLGHVENEVAEGLERRWTEAIEAESRRLHAETETGLKRVRSEYLRIRLFGLVLLVGGGVLTAVADFVA